MNRFATATFAAITLITALFAGQAAAQEEPPGRVGRISVMEGEVWLRDATSPNPFTGTLNWPVTQGTSFDTGLNARAEIRVGSTAVRLGSSTNASFDTLNDDAQRIALTRGSLSVRLRSMERARETVVITPQGNVVFADAGRYRIDVTNYGEINITVLQGNARFDGRSFSVSVGSGRQLALDSNGQSRFVEIYGDTFSDWVQARDREFDRRPTARYISPELTGGEALDEHGSWTVSASYGPVWYPTAYPVGWAPYRMGRWVWMQPWGWTWVDSQPWGFAVSHYGRWASIDGRWGWVPGEYVARPVWAPALVAWAGGSRWSVSLNFGYPSVGWVPLAPYEVFVPYYAAPRRYWHAVNTPYVRNVTVVNYVQQNPGSQSYANASVAGAVSAASAASTFARGAAAPSGAAARQPAVFAAVQSAAARDAFLGSRIVAPAANPNVAPQAIAPAPAMNAAAAAARGVVVPSQTNPVSGAQRIVPDVAGRTDARVAPPAQVQSQVQPGAAQNSAAQAAAQAAVRSPNYIKSAPGVAEGQPIPQVQRVAPPKDAQRAEQAAAEAARRANPQWQQRPEMRAPAPQQLVPQAPQAAPQLQQFQRERKEFQREQAMPQQWQQRERAEPRTESRAESRSIERGMQQGRVEDAVVRAVRER
jgi:hypothetical protein